MHIATAAASPAVHYRERLSPSLWTLLSAAVAAPMVSLVFVPLDATVALLAGLAVAVVIVATLVLGIDSDRLFPVDGQHRIARGIRSTIDDGAVVLSSDFGHDGFLIETAAVGAHLRRLLQA